MTMSLKKLSDLSCDFGAAILAMTFWDISPTYALALIFLFVSLAAVVVDGVKNP